MKKSTHFLLTHLPIVGGYFKVKYDMVYPAGAHMDAYLGNLNDDVRAAVLSDYRDRCDRFRRENPSEALTRDVAWELFFEALNQYT